MVFDPNIAYILLVLAFVLGVFALAAPGTGFIEVAALVMMVAAGYALSTLPFNVWALAILVVGLPFFFVAVRPGPRWRQWLFLILALICFWGGSVLMFSRPDGGLLAINPFLAAVLSLVIGVFMWLAFKKSIQAHLIPVKNPMEGLIGMQGMSETRIDHEGTVRVGSEAWSAWSKTPIPAHSPIRVVARQGLILEVEAVAGE